MKQYTSEGIKVGDRVFFQPHNYDEMYEGTVTRVGRYGCLDIDYVIRGDSDAGLRHTRGYVPGFWCKVLDGNPLEVY